jgi:hypothetical protein
MKVKIEMTLDIDPYAWRRRFDPDITLLRGAQVRRSVKDEVVSRVTRELLEAGLLMEVEDGIQ